MGSPRVFQTAPPHPASNARSTIEPMFVGGAEASQKGLGDLMPAKATLRSAMSRKAFGGVRTQTLRLLEQRLERREVDQRQQESRQHRVEGLERIGDGGGDVGPPEQEQEKIVERQPGGVTWARPVLEQEQADLREEGEGEYQKGRPKGRAEARLRKIPSLGFKEIL